MVCQRTSGRRSTWCTSRGSATPRPPSCSASPTGRSSDAWTVASSCWPSGSASSARMTRPRGYREPARPLASAAEEADMADDPRVQHLLEELFDGRATPEEVCGECPELLPAVRERWRRICRARGEVEALFPRESGPAGSVPASPSDEAPPLPAVPGYEVESVLGHGGMGVVYKARHLRLNRLVALKMALAGPNERERFRREAEAVAALRHPNVVQVYDVGDADGRPYFT